MKIQGIYTFLQAALLLLFASCSQEETGGVTPLPDGKYPLQLTVEQAQPQTRSGGKDTWTGITLQSKMVVTKYQKML